MLNWRKPFINFLLRATGSQIPKLMKYVESIEYKSSKEIQEIHNQNLKSLLQHAWENTKYYNEILSDCGVVKDRTIHLDNFDKIPFLTKDIIRNESDRLKARNLPKGKKPYKNSSGGSTGQPVEFLQDSFYDAVNTANKLYHFKIFGKEAGELETKIWGSERDLFEGTIGLSAKIQNFLYNRKFENCFRLTKDNIKSIIDNMNKYRPKTIWAYLDGVHAVADYAIQNNIKLHSPVAIIVGATTLYPHIKEAIEKAFSAPVINYYGSREMGAMACQCTERNGLHIASHSHRIETINLNGNTTFEEEGELVVTSLTNYAMPFIRYRIGDHGKLTSKKCPCGRGFPMLESLTGRVVERFINHKGDHISPMYFIHLMGVVYNPGYIKKFQVIQDDYLNVSNKMILRPGVKADDVRPFLRNVTEKIKLVMGEECTVKYDFLDDIPPAKSGKHLYVVNKIPRKESALTPSVDAA